MTSSNWQAGTCSVWRRPPHGYERAPERGLRGAETHEPKPTDHHARSARRRGQSSHDRDQRLGMRMMFLIYVFVIVVGTTAFVLVGLTQP